MSEEMTKAQLESLKEFIAKEFLDIKEHFDKIETSIESIRASTVPIREYEKDMENAK